MPLQIIRNDITKVKADAIVNTANPEVAIGEVAITSAFKLNAKYIIHFSGPHWIDGMHREEELLRQCYDKSLELAYKRHCKSIAFPLMATGTYGFPKELGLKIALESFNAFLLLHEMEIILVVFGETAYKVSGKIFDDVREYVDNSYVERRLKLEYRHDGIPAERGTKEINEGSTPLFIDENRGRMPAFSMAIPNFVQENWEEEELDEKDFEEEQDKKLFQIKTALPSHKLDFYMQQDLGTFGEYLQQMINKKGMKNSEVYTAANLTKQYFSKLLKGKVTPSKTKVLSLAVALQLNMDETIDFLRMSGYAFSPFSQVDKIFEYFIRNEIYDIYRIDIVLFDYGLPTLVND